MNSTFTSTGGVVHPTSSAAEKIHYARLADLPDGLAFPVEFQERIWFEPQKQRLAFRGFMSKAAFDRLQSLHRSSAYRHALEALFQSSTLEKTTKLSVGASHRWLAAAAILATIMGIGATLLLLLS